MRLALVALAMMPSFASWSAEPWDAAVQRLCNSLSQDDCWIKSGASICDREQAGCRNLPDHTPAVVLGKVGKRWHVRTSDGDGWVNERWMMLDGSKMR